MPESKPLQLVHKEIERSFQQHIERAQEFLRVPSVSSDRPALLKTVGLLKQYLESAGGEVQFFGNPEAPIVYARFDRHQPKTLLVYGMYDVQAVTGQEWSVPPFSAEMVDVDGAGPSIIARGACNSKGPLIGFINALTAIQEVDKLPVNLIFTIEGEEEIGSLSLPKFYEENRALLQADAGLEPFWAEYGTDVDRPTLALGNKGIIGIELVCHGGDWGGPVSNPIHSSAAAWLASPLWRLIHAAGSFVDSEERIAIDGFFDEVTEPTREELNLLEKLSETFSEKSMMSFTGARRFKLPGQGIELLRQYLYSPSISISFKGMPDSDVIPTEARAEVSIRTVPDMDIQETIEKIRRHLNRKGYADIAIQELYSYPYSKTRLDQPVVQAMLKAYRHHHAEPQIYPIMASATPYYLFSKVLGIPYTWGGLGKAGKSHAPDEFASIDGFKLLEKSLATFLYFYAQN